MKKAVHGQSFSLIGVCSRGSGRALAHVCGAENGDFAVHRLTRASEEALQKHRMQGHVPFGAPSVHVVNQYFTIGVGVQIC